MDRSAFEEMRKNQETHWWFKGKRLALERLISRYCDCQKELNILEIGCGTGANLSMLKSHGSVVGLELDDYARNCAAVCNPSVEVLKGWLPDGLEAVQDQKFELICMFDVLEHIEYDEEALIKIKRLLTKNGSLLLTVPAYQWMYSVHDVNLGHFRRYNKKDIRMRLIKAGYHVEFSGYMNMLTLPLMIGARLGDRILKREKSLGAEKPPGLVNQILYFLFYIEALWLPYVKSPCGGSVLSLATVLNK